MNELYEQKQLNRHNMYIKIYNKYKYHPYICCLLPYILQYDNFIELIECVAIYCKVPIIEIQTHMTPEEILLFYGNIHL